MGSLVRCLRLSHDVRDVDVPEGLVLQQWVRLVGDAGMVGDHPLHLPSGDVEEFGYLPDAPFVLLQFECGAGISVDDEGGELVHDLPQYYRSHHRVCLRLRRFEHFTHGMMIDIGVHRR